MPLTRLGLTLALLCVPTLAHAQFGRELAKEDTPEEEEEKQAETEVKARADLSVVYYKETESGTPNVPNTSQASPNAIFYTDLRGHLEANHISGSKFDVLADLRLRLNPDPNAPARGYLGGDEYDLKELFSRYSTGKIEAGLGRMIIRDVDATTVDGARFIYRTSARFEIGAFGGLFPDPFSRSLESDYSIATMNADGTITEKFASPVPLVAGAWVGYRSERAYGSIGAGSIFARDPIVMSSANRQFVTSFGYFRVSSTVDVFHTVAIDVAGPAGAQILTASVGTRYRPTTRLELEAGASRMSTYAIERYVRDLLEVRNPLMGTVQNNTEIVRMGTNEVRGGANYLFPKQRVNLYGQLRYREREGLVLPQDLATIYADKVIDVSTGLRQRRSVWKLDVSGNLIVIRGVRSASNIGMLRASRIFMNNKLNVDADASFTQYQDNCPRDVPDPTCPGSAKGQSIRLGAMAAYRKDAHWLIIGDYHLQQNAATGLRPNLMTQVLEVQSFPVILGHTIFLRGQYVY